MATIIPSVDAVTWDRLTLAARVIAPADPAGGHAIVAAGLRDGLRVTAAVVGTTVIGAVLSRYADGTTRTELLSIGVAPEARRAGLAARLLAAHVGGMRPGDVDIDAEITVAERDPVEPIDGDLRRAIGRRLLEGAGFRVGPADPVVRAADPAAVAATGAWVGRTT
jgi:ribosomal protein S18 acetylase RimI-like enzyme